VFLEPFYLGLDVAVDDVALLVLEAPGNDDEEVAFSYPESLFYLSLDPAHPCDAVGAPDTDVICPQHQLGTGKYLLVSLLGQPHADDLCIATLRIFSFCQEINSLTNSGLFPEVCRFMLSGYTKGSSHD
jgi:hypothetical protein